MLQGLGQSLPRAFAFPKSLGRIPGKTPLATPPQAPVGRHFWAFPSDPPRQIRASARVQKIYLGTDGPMPILEVHGIHTYYGDAYVLQSVSLSLEKRARSSVCLAATASARPRW